MNNVLLMLGAIVAGILAALVAVPMAIDWNGYRGVFEEEASRLLGRDVRLGGGVNVRVLPVPYVRFEKLRIADTASTGGDPLFRAESVTMRLSIAPLLRGVLEAQSVELKKPSLRLVVDGEGRGNWASLSLKPGSLPFVPADVTLQSVGIEGGTMVFVSGTGKELAEFQGIDGELSADGFEGPFKFKGNAAWYGEQREIRFATSKPEADGSTKFRASVRVPANQNSYSFDGRVLDLKGRPHLDGELTAKLPIAGAAPAKVSVAGKAPGEVDSNVFELKAKVDGDLKGGKLTDIALSLDRVGDPQLITGEATAAWNEALRFDMVLTTRSLNLDAIGAEGSSKDPLETARNSLNVILAALPAEAQTDARLKAERVTLAGESITGVSLAMNRRDAALEVKELRAILPGATKLDASGSIKREAKSDVKADTKSWAFAGPVMLRGGNLSRFMSWARNDTTIRLAAGTSSGHYEGPFMLDGQLAMSGGNFALTRVVAEFADQPVTGEFRFTSEGRRRVEIVLQGQRIDAAQVWPGGFDLDRLRAFLSGSPHDAAAGSGKGTGTAGLYGLNPDTTDVKAEVRAGEFQANATTNLRDFTALFTVERGTLMVPRVTFQTANGLSVDLDGQVSGLTLVANAAGAAGATGKTANVHKGVMRFVVGAPGPAAMADLFTYLNWPQANRPGDETIASLGAVRLAGSATLGERGANSTDIALDGMIDGGRVAGVGKLDQGLGEWRTGAMDLNATIDTPNIGRWLGLAGVPMKAQTQGAMARPGQIFVNAIGQPQGGLTTLASVTSEDLSVAYQGMVALPKDGAMVADGAAGIAGRDGADVLALADLSFGQGGFGVPLQGQVEVKLAGKMLGLTLTNMKAGATRISGKASVELAKAGDDAQALRKVSADLSVDQATVPGLMSVVSDRRAQSQSKDGNQSLWPDQPLVFTGLDHVQGDVALTIGRLGLDGTSMLTNVKAKLGLAPSAISINEIVGTGLGGSLKAKFALMKAPGGATLTGEGSLTDARLAADMPISLTATLTSQGLSASGLVAALKGQGNATINGGQIKGIAPAGVAAAVEAVLADKSPPTGEALGELLRDTLAPTGLTLPQRKIPFALVNGVARIPVTAFDTLQGRAHVESMFDVNSGRYVTDWRIEAVAKPGVTGKLKASLPAVVVTMSGGLGNLAEADRKMTMSAFEQELSLRKLERDAEELERIRKFDDDRRAKEDADRAAKIAAEAAAAAAAEAAAKAQSATPGSASGDAGERVIVVPMPIETIRPKTGETGANGTDGAASGGAGNAGQAASTPAPVPAEAAQVPQPTPAVRPPSQNSAARRRTPDAIPQPFQNNF